MPTEEATPSTYMETIRPTPTKTTPTTLTENTRNTHIQLTPPMATTSKAPPSLIHHTANTTPLRHALMESSSSIYIETTPIERN